jgi:hypothetical protein
LFNKLSPLDLLSFWLGFLLSSALWLVVTRIIKLVPRLRETVRKNKIIQKNQTTVSIYDHLRKRILRKCQSSHISASMFPLNSIYVDIPLLISPIIPDPRKEPVEVPFIHKIIPYIPECPELLVDLHIPTFSLVDALSQFQNVAVLGEIGSGKTTLLSQFASKIIENSPDVTEFHGFFPLFLHVSELDFSLSEDIQPLNSLNSSPLIDFPGMSLEIIHEIIYDYAQSGHIIVLLDGLDEVDGLIFNKAVNWIKLFQNSFPTSRFVISSGPFYIDGLDQVKFMPCFMAPLNTNLRNKMFDSWVEAWQKLQLGEPKNDFSINALDLLWLHQEIKPGNVLTASLQIWSHLISHCDSSNLITLTSGYLEAVTNNIISTVNLINIAEAMFHSTSFGITKKDIVSLLHSDQADTLSPQIRNNFVEPAVNSRDAITPDTIITLLKVNGLLIERKKELYQFSNPLVYAYLLSQSPKLPFETNWNILLRSPLAELTLRLSGQIDYISDWIKSPDIPLFRNILLTAKHLPKLELSSEVCKTIFQEVSNLLLNKIYPFSSRVRLLTVFTATNDPSFTQFFKYLLKHPDPIVRQIGAFGFSLHPSDANIQQILDLIYDSSNNVNSLACTLLSKFWNPKFQKPFIDLLLHGTETNRRIIAEVLASKSEDGIELLKEATTIEDILSRKSAILGLRLIKEPWVKLLFEKISTEDKQWIVRDAAIHALETFDDNPFINSLPPTSAPSDSKWLLEFASKNGMGIPPNVFPYDLLFMALDSGSDLEKQAAIHYLASQPNPVVIKELNLLIEKENSVRDLAVGALFSISRIGSR